jgi:predicted glycosyltransferase
MNRILIISLNSGGTMGHGKIITSLANFLSQKGKQVTILSDMSFSKNFEINDKVNVKNIGKTPHINYTIGGMCRCNQSKEIYESAKKQDIECVIFSTFFDLDLVKKFKNNKIKTILLSYPIRDTYRLALKQNRAYATFDKIITLFSPEFNDEAMSNEILVNPLIIAHKRIENKGNNDILITCGGGGRPSSRIFFRKTVSAIRKIIDKNKNLKIIVIKGSSRSNIPNKNIKAIIWTKNFESIISSSNLIISEAGYFTMLDLINCKKRAILIPGERIIDNQEIRALKLEELGLGKIFFPFEKKEKLINLINEGLKEKYEANIFKDILTKFSKYPEFGEILLNELK